MKISSVFIKNFMTIGIANLNLEDKGLVLVQGLNKDDPSATSNGSGKSTSVNAIMWCLTGETPMGISGDNIISRKHGKGTEVTVTIDEQFGEHYKQYEITRYRKAGGQKANSLRVSVYDSVTGEKTKLEGNSKHTQSIIFKILGCNKEVFNATVYSAQDAMVDLPSMTDVPLKAIVENAAGIEVLSAAYVIARKNHAAMKSKHGDTMHAHQRLTDKLVTLKAQLDREKALSAGFAGEKSIEIKSHESKVKYLNEQLSEAKKQMSIVKYDEDKHKQIVGRIAEINKALLESQEQQDNYMAAVGVITKKIATCNSKISTIKSAIAVLAAKALDVASEEDDSCPRCGSKHDNTQYKLDQQAEIQDKTSDFSMNQQAAEMLVAELELEQRKLVKPEGVDSSEYSRLNAELEVMQEMKELKVSRNADICRKEDQINVVFDQIDQVKLKENPHVDMVEELEGALVTASENAQVADQAVQFAETNMKAAERVKQIYAPAGVRAHVLDQVTPFLNDLTSKYLNALTDGYISVEWNTQSVKADGEMTERFSIDLVSEESALVYKGLSGGEKRKVKLACSMALQGLVASRATKSIDLFIADEIDDAIDASGLERLMGLMQEKAADHGTVIVISHNDLGDWISQTSLVTREGGESSISGALSA